MTLKEWFEQLTSAQGVTALPEPLWRGMVCLDIAITFADDRTRLGLPAAVARLREVYPAGGVCTALFSLTRLPSKRTVVLYA